MFMKMLKNISKAEEKNIKCTSLDDINADIDRNDDMNEVGAIISEHNTLNSISALDMTLSENIVSENNIHQQSEIEVDSLQLDGETVRMVDEHIRKVYILYNNY